VTGPRAGVLLAFAVAVLCGFALRPATAMAGPCDPPNNEIVCENSKSGNPESEWDVDGAGDPSIQGFATDISVDRGETISFKVDTNSTKYRLDIYRMGYYGGDGARKVATVAGTPHSQPACEEEASTGLIDCGNWAVSASWEVPSTAVSGIYFAHLEREDKSSEGSQIVFVVRDDESESELLFQTSDTTWEAYNEYGGNSLYTGDPGEDPGRAYKVSYNRPLTTRGTGAQDAPFNAEYPMVRWLERNGYDVSYFTGVDSDRRGGEILNHRIFLSVGHDEYWSGTQRANVEAAREAGVNLAFFSGNEVFWKTRWEDSIDGSGTDHRTLVCYKETHANEPLDPEDPGTWTGTWRDPRFSPPADGGRPENELTGTIFAVNVGTTAIEVPAKYSSLRIWRNTDIADLEPGETATLGEDTLGYEWDEDAENGFRPAGLVPLSSTTDEVPQRLVDYGSTYSPGEATHHLTLYRAESGALVFGAGTVQWPWGLDDHHDRGEEEVDSRMQQATVNLFADMGAQPATLQAGLVAAAQTTDSTPPTVAITKPAAEIEVQSGQPYTIEGSASDSEGEGQEGGVIGAVEVSVDGGESWHLADGAASWSYTWTPEELGATTILARATDDSANLGASAEVDVEVTAQACPCSIWDPSFEAPQDSDSNAIELGVRFRSEVTGYVSGIRFYKTSGNTGTHVGRLWTASGEQLAQVTFTGESGSGWQQAEFDTPVEIQADTTYVASYYAPFGHYASVEDYFTLVGYDNPPLHALADGVDGANGIYKYGSSGGLFSDGGPNTFHSENYLVDVSFEKKLVPDTTPPTIGSRTPVDGATEVPPEVSPSASFDEAMDPATVDGTTVELEDSLGTPIPATVSYDAGQRRATIEPSEALDYSTTYTATVRGGPGGVADLAGNHLAADSSWSFSTAPPPPAPPDEGPGGPILVIAGSGNAFSRYYDEILRSEGLNEFTATDITNVTPSLLDEYDVAILGDVPVSVSQAQTLTSWVEAGGNLIAMRPDGKLAGLLGLSPAGGSLGNAYLKVDTGTAPGAGIVGQTIQFHGAADRYTTAGAQTIATLYSDASTSTANPAVTMREVGENGGHAAAFTYDLAKSVVYTRQGNPAWNEEERDGISPVRSDDLFYGAKEGDEQPDWVNLDKAEIPQADEQQRLLTNLIERMNLDRKPLPRFWFLPEDHKAAVVMTGDDHGNNGTTGRFEHLKSLDPSGCVVSKWECVRSTSYIYPNTPITDAKAAAFVGEGFEIGVHITTGCRNWDDEEDLENVYSGLLDEFAEKFPSLPAPATNRMHCIVWSDWATQPKVELKDGIRLDTTYYYWPAKWVQDRPGMFTGSGMPMRFANLDGSLIDVYQAPTQMTDESEQTYPFNAEVLLDNALGSKGYYGAFVANMHNDKVESPEADAIVAAAQARGVPVISARQLLTWLDGRNQSSFGAIEWSGDDLSFTISPGAGASGLRAMVPVEAGIGSLEGIEREGTPVATTTRTVKGVEYAFFDATAGGYTATYKNEELPEISNVQTEAANDGTATVSWETSKPADSKVEYGTSAGALESSVSDPALLTSHSLQLSGLEPGATYYFRVTSADGEANSVTAPESPLAPGTFQTPPAPPALTATVPASPANQTSPKLVGSAGAGTTIDVYAGAACPGSPVASGTAAELEAGITVEVAADTTTALRATASSAAGASSCSEPLSYVEDSTGPDTQITTAPPALTAEATAEFAFSGDDGAGSGVASYECRLDGGAWGACESAQEYVELGDGSHEFQVRAVDQAGNADPEPASSEWNVDAQAPDTSIGTHPAAVSADAEAKFGFSGDDGLGSGVAYFECSIDGAAWEPCGTPRIFTGLGDGSHEFQVKAVDNAGNVDPSPAPYTWTVDTAAPNTIIETNPEGLADSAKAKFTFSGDDGSGSGIASFQCRLDSGSFEPCSSGQEYTGLAEGAHTFEVKAIDNAGNADASPATFAWSVDTEAPDTTIESEPAALANAAAAKFTFSGEDPGGSGIASYECRLDSGSFDACTSPREYTELAEGAHSFEVRAIDKAGNADASPATYNWSIDLTAPTVTIDSLSKSLLKAGESAELTWHADENGGFELRKGGADCATGTVIASGPYTGQPAQHTSEVKASDLAEGPNALRLCLADAAGNHGSATASVEKDTAAPTTTIESEPAAIANTAAAKFTFSGDDASGSGVASFQCRLDSGSFGACESPREYSGLAEGPHEFAVRAIDKAGNVDGSPATFAWSVDTIAPETTIDSHPTAFSASVDAEFKFSGSDTGSGVGIFECRQDSISPGAWQPCVSPLVYSSLAQGTHKFEVRTVDKAGNPDPEPASFEWTIDSQAPETTLDTNPASLTDTATAKFTFSGDDASGSGVASFQCRLDAGGFGACSPPQEYSGLAEGAHSFEVRAIDKAGNADASPATYNWSIDLTAPTVTIDSLSKSLLKAGESAELTWHADENGGFELRKGGADCATGTVIASGPYTGQPAQHTSEVKASDLAEGPNALRLCLADAAGNHGSATASVEKDTAAPTTTIDTNPAAIADSAKAKFTFSGEDPGGSGIASFQCRLDAGGFGACSSPQEYSSLAEGAHSFEVRAIDKAGNADGSPATFAWSVDTEAPDTTIESEPAALANTAAAKFTFSGDDAAGSGFASFQCRLDAGGFGACSSPQEYSGLAEGAHSFEVRAIDKAGNVDPVPASYEWTIDSLAPETQIESKPGAVTGSAEAKFTFSGSDGAGSGVASFECRRDSTDPEAWGGCGSPQEYAELGDGTHRFEVRAVDVAGNADGSPAGYEWTVDTTAPQVQVDSGPETFSAVADANFAFSASDSGGSGVATVECHRDAEAWAPCGSPRFYASLAEGLHEFQLRAVDNAGNTGALSSPYQWTIDTKAPQTTIDTKPASLANTAAAKFTFSGDDASGSGIASYQCRLDGASFGACTSPKEYSGLSEAPHSFDVRAIDKAGNVDASPATFNWQIDLTAPTVTIDSLSKSLLKAGESAELTWHADENGEFQLRLGASDCASGTVIASGEYTGQPAPHLTEVKASDLAEGANSLRLCLADAAGNHGAATAGVEKDTAAPETTIDTNPASLANSATAKFSFSGDDASGSGIASFQCRLDGASFGACTSPKEYSGLSEGAHEFAVRAIDKAGNVDASPAVFNWSVDTEAPQTTIDSNPASLANTAAAKFTFSGDDASGSGIASYECRLDGASFSTCSSGVELSGLAEGAHSFEVRAIDKAGNVDPVPASYGWQIDLTAPTIQIDSGPEGLTNDPLPTFAFSAEAGASVECSIDQGTPGFGPCSSAGGDTPESPLPDGEYTFRVRAADAAGNQAVATREFSVEAAAPDPPQLTTTDPVSPANENNPQVIGTAQAETTVKLYAGADCSGSPIGSGSPAQLKAGIVVAVPDNSTTSFRATATNALGTASGCSEPLVYVEDSEAPDTTIDTKPASLANTAAAKFTFSGDDASGSGIASYECRLDGAGFEPCPSETELTGLAEGAHEFAVRAIDKAGNVDASPATFNWQIDLTAPAVAIDSLSKSLLKAGESAELTWHADENGEFQLRLGASDCASGTVLASGEYTAQPAPHLTEVKASDLAEGANSLRLCLTDAAGNHGSATASVEKDTAAPETTIDTNPASLANSATAKFSFSGDDSAGSGIASYECKLDGASFSTCSSGIELTGLAEGAHEFAVRAIDKAGNADASPATYGWSVDLTAPAVAIDSLSKALLKAGESAELTWHADENGGFELRKGAADCATGTVIASGEYTAQPAPHLTEVKASDLAEGANALRLCLADAAGNHGAATAGVEKDTEAPQTTIDTNPAALANSAAAKFSFSGDDASGSGVASYECRLDSGSFSPCASGIELSGLAEGAHSFEVRAIDKAGNVDASPAVFNWNVDTEAPQTTIDSKPASLANSASAEFTFSGDDASGSGIASFQCSLDGASFGACTSPKEYSGLSEGAHSFEVRAIDKAGNVDASPATFNWQIDLTAPTVAIDSLSKTLLKAGESAELTWHADENGEFQLRLGASDCASGTVLASGEYSAQPVPHLTEVKASDLAEGANSLRLCLTDAAGNHGSATASVEKDTAAPETTIDTKPASLANSATAKFSFSGDDASGSGVASYQCRLDAGSFGACESPQEYSGLSEGAHEFAVRAIDKAGNVDASPATFNWQIDLTAPAVAIDSLSKSLLKAGESAELTWHADENGEFQLRLGASDCASGTVLASGEYTAQPAPHLTEVKASDLAEGANSLRLCLTDAAGNHGAATAGVEKDTAVPQTTIDTNPAAIADSAKAKFTFSGSDPEPGSGVASYECRLDSGSFSPCASGIELSGLAEGAHSFEVRAIDKAGNVDASPAVFNWNVDTEAAQTTIDSNPASLANTATAKFTFSGDDASGSGVASFQCSLDGASFGACTSPKEYSGLSEGAHSFEVRAIDNAGNADQSPAVHEWSVDTTPPAVSVDSGPEGLTNNPSPTFAFSSEPGAGFECSIDSGTPDFAPCSAEGSHTPESPLPDGEYSFRVRATDAAGNAAVATREFKVDTAAPAGPQLTSTSPASPADENHPELFGTAPAGTTVKLYGGADCSGAPIATLTPAELAAGVEVSVPDDSTTTFRATATTAAENTSGCSEPLVYVEDSSAPTTTITTKPASLIAVDHATFQFTGADPGGSGVASFQCRLDGGSFGACSSGIELTGLSDGSHTFAVRAIDNAGNADGSPASYEWSVDTGAPTTTIATKPASLIAVDHATFQFTGADPGGSGVASFQCRLDGASFSACTSGIELTGLSEGSHTFAVRAIDNAGNADGSPASYEWSVDTGAPSTTLDTHPAAISPSADASFAFSGDDGAGSGVASYQCRRDSAAAVDWEPCGSPKAYKALAEGSHEFEVRAIDEAGNADQTPASFAWEIDTKAPNTQIDSNPASLIAVDHATFEFSASDPEPSAGLASFQCRLDGASFEPCSSGVELSSLAEGAHSFEVRAIDNAGNADGSPASYEWSVDTGAPTTTIATKPASLIAVDHATFQFTGADPGGSGVASFQCRLDGASFSACTSGIELTGLSEGSHTFAVRAIDNAGNADGSPASYEWSVDTGAPSTTLDTHPAAISPSADASFAFSGDDGAGSGVASYQCRRDSAAAVDWEPCGSPKAYKALAEGSHEFEVRAIDEAGNADQTPASFAWEIDTKAPNTQIDSNPASLIAVDHATFEFSASDPEPSAGLASFQCRLDGASFEPCSSGVELSSLAEGAHSFEVRAIDNAGNVDGSPAVFNWSVDTEAPQTTIDTKPASLANSAKAKFTFSGNDSAGSGIASFQCRLDGGGFGACSSPQEYSGLSEGAHEFAVRAIDKAGNVDASPATYGWSVDTTPPAVGIDSGPEGLTNDSTPTFGFHAGEEGAAVLCSIDSGTPDFAPCSAEGSHTPESPLPDGEYSFRVRATDAAGNQATATRGFKVDTAAPAGPQLTSTSPASPADENHPELFGTAPAGTTVKLYSGADCSGAPIATLTPAELEAGVEVSVADDSSTAFRATATTAAENTSGCSEPLVYVEDSSAPTTTIATKPASLIAVDHATFQFTGADPGGSGLASFQCRLDGGSFSACSSGIELTGLSDGSHTFAVRAIDNAGNADGSPASFSWTVDTTAPQTTIDSKPASLTNSAAAEFAFSGDDGAGSGIASFQCRLDGGGFSACASPQEYTGLAEGAHSFEVRAIDEAGNTDSTPASYEWTVDTAMPDPPQLTSTDPASPADDNHPKLFGTAPTGATSVKLYSGADCSGAPIATITPAELEAGAEVSVADDSSTAFRATATTAAGNTSGCSEPLVYVEDSTAPQASIDAHPAAVADSGNAEFAFSGSDSGSGVVAFQCRLDSGAWSVCDSPKRYSGLADGAHVFDVRAIDVAANESAPATFAWAIDTAAAEPSPPSTSTPAPVPSETGEEPPHALKPPTGQAKLLRVRHDARKGTALLIFAVPEPGVLSARPPAVSLGRTSKRRGTAQRIRRLRLLQRRIKPRSIRIAHSGTVKIPIVLTKAGRKLLRRTHRLKVKAVIRYRAASAKATWKIAVTLKKKRLRVVAKTRHKKK